MLVFDRWGEQIFVSIDIATGWDGKYMGSDVPEGIYVYMITYATFDYFELQKHSKIGRVSLIR